MGEDSLEGAVQKYLDGAPGVKEHCDRCLDTARWGGKVALMVVDAAFTSVGLNYFAAVVPKVEQFERRFVKTGRIITLGDLANAELAELQGTWRNKRSWEVAGAVGAYLSRLGEEAGVGEREALRLWAGNAGVRGWRMDPIGSIKGVGINTYQYLRMMGGVDTVMPDKIVRRAIIRVLEEGGIKTRALDDVEFVELVQGVAAETGHRAIELCWAAWLHESENELAKTEKYAGVISRI